MANTGHGSDVSPERDALLNQVSVLIVEDEPFIALDLATAVEEARGKVIGPGAGLRGSELADVILKNAVWNARH